MKFQIFSYEFQLEADEDFVFRVQSRLFGAKPNSASAPFEVVVAMRNFSSRRPRFSPWPLAGKVRLRIINVGQNTYLISVDPFSRRNLTLTGFTLAELLCLVSADFKTSLIFTLIISLLLLSAAIIPPPAEYLAIRDTLKDIAEIDESE